MYQELSVSVRAFPVRGNRGDGGKWYVRFGRKYDQALNIFDMKGREMQDTQTRDNDTEMEPGEEREEMSS